MAFTNLHQLFDEDSQKHAPLYFADKTNWSETTLRMVKRTLTSAEILALDSTPIELVPAVPNIVYVPIKIVAILKFNTTAYSTSSGIDLRTSVSSTGMAVTSALISGAASRYQSNQVELWSDKLTSEVLNANLNLLANGAITTGDSDIDIYVWYHQILVL